MPSLSKVSVRYATANGTATAGSDYTATSGTLTFLPGQTRVTVKIPVQGDGVQEANETFRVNLSAASGGKLIIPQGIGTLRNDD